MTLFVILKFHYHLEPLLILKDLLQYQGKFQTFRGFLKWTKLSETNKVFFFFNVSGVFVHFILTRLFLERNGFR